MTSLVDRGLLGNDYAVHGNTLSPQGGCKRTCSVGAVCSLPFRSTYAVCRHQPHQVSDLRAHLCDCQFFQQGAKLHDRCHLAGGKILPGAQRPFLPIRYETHLRRSYSPIPAIARIAIPAKIIPATWRNKAEASGCEFAVVNGQLFPRLQGHLPGIYDLKRGDSAALQLPAHHSCEWADRCFVDVRHLKPCRIQFVARPHELASGVPAS